MLDGSVSEWNYGKAEEERAMRRLSITAFVGMLALTMAGCGLLPGSEEISATTPSAPQVVEKQPGAQLFDKPPMVTQQAEKIATPSANGLIQLTNANQRVKQVQKGRQDPFAGLSLPKSSLPIATPQRPIPQLPSFPIAPPRQTVAVQPRSPNQPNRKVVPPPRVVRLPSPFPVQANPPLPPVIPGSTVEPFLPPPPQEPDVARGVAIKGVIQIGNDMQAIVQVPNEATSRYVRLGQRLSNGQVLVKRIEMNEGSDPVVILEQYGIEVAKTVGEEAVNSAQTGTPTDASPVAPPPEDNAPASGDSGTPTDSPVPQQPDSAPTSEPSGTPTDSPVPQQPDSAPTLGPSGTPTDASPVPPQPDSAPTSGDG